MDLISIQFKYYSLFTRPFSSSSFFYILLRPIFIYFFFLPGLLNWTISFVLFPLSIERQICSCPWRRIELTISRKKEKIKLCFYHFSRLLWYDREVDWTGIFFFYFQTIRRHMVRPSSSNVTCCLSNAFTFSMGILKKLINWSNSPFQFNSIYLNL